MTDLPVSLDFSKISVAALGDIVLDRFVWGQARRLSPEAPVPVVCPDSQTECAGGVGNVVANLLGLGASVRLCALVGRDAAATQLASHLQSLGAVHLAWVETETRPTSVKTRFVASGQHVMRFDEEVAAPMPEWLEQQVL